MKQELTIYTCDKCGKEIGKSFVYTDFQLSISSREQNTIFETKIHLCDTCKENIRNFIKQEFTTEFKGV